MLSCVCRPVNSSLPKPPLAMAPQKRPSIVVTCEPRIATATIVTKKVTLYAKNQKLFFFVVAVFLCFDIFLLYFRWSCEIYFQVLCDFMLHFCFFIRIRIIREKNEKKVDNCKWSMLRCCRRIEKNLFNISLITFSAYIHMNIDSQSYVTHKQSFIIKYLQPENKIDI